MTGPEDKDKPEGEESSQPEATPEQKPRVDTSNPPGGGDKDATPSDIPPPPMPPMPAVSPEETAAKPASTPDIEEQQPEEPQPPLQLENEEPLPPQGNPTPPPPVEDDERTRIGGVPPGPVPPVPDLPAAPEMDDHERTRIGGVEPPLAPAATPPADAPIDTGDDERTRIGSPTPDAAPAAPVLPIAPPPTAPPAGMDADERTRIGQPAAASQPPQQTPLQQPPLPTAEDPAGPVAQEPAPPPDEADRTRVTAGPVPEQTAASVAPVPPGAAARQRQADGVHTVDIGTLINNNYEVKEVLKSGGMGEVYRGENVFTGDPVAIKVVLPELAEDEKAGLLFMREARTLSQLSDDAIVRYYNFVKDPVIDRYCLIMEFIKGVPLSDYTAQNGPVTKEAAEVLLRRLAKGLEKAHARDVIHRDLSPDNVMLPDGIIAEALLIDFGIAKSNVVKEGTMAGQFAGKFKYVSPEQLGHFGGEIGPATDIYGLALLISAALLGKPLDMGSSIVEAVQRRQAIPDLSELPEELRPILSYMLEPDPADRPEDMQKVGHLVDHPEEIPGKYRAGLPPLPPRQTTMTGGMTTAGGLSVPPVTVSGLQQPPTTATGPGGLHGVTTTSEPLPEKGSGKGMLFVTLLLAAMAGGGYYAWTEGLIGPLAGSGFGTPDETPDEPAQAGLPDIQPNTREGFLASFDTGPCSYATRIGSGPNAGMVQGFSPRQGVFNGLPTAYEEQFGARPAILESQITPEQCAALGLVKLLQGRGQSPVALQVDAGEVESGDPISGRVVDGLGRNVWLVLISPKGGVYNLTARLSDPVGDRRTFRFGLSLADGSAAAPQLLMAIATEEPLVNAAQARDGSDASVLLPLIEEEITRKGGQSAAALAHILLVPDVPDDETGDDGEVDDDPGDDADDLTEDPSDTGDGG